MMTSRMRIKLDRWNPSKMCLPLYSCARETIRTGIVSRRERSQWVGKSKIRSFKNPHSETNKPFPPQKKKKKKKKKICSCVEKMGLIELSRPRYRTQSFPQTTLGCTHSTSARLGPQGGLALAVILGRRIDARMTWHLVIGWFDLGGS